MTEHELIKQNLTAIAALIGKFKAMTVGINPLNFELQYAYMNNIQQTNTSVSYVTDIFNFNYFFLNPSFLHLTGFDAEHIQQAGLPFLHSIIYKKDVTRFCAICSSWYDYLLTLPEAERTAEEAVIHFRIVNAAGTIIWTILYLQIWELDCNGNPAMEKGTYKNNSLQKTDTNVWGTTNHNGIITMINYSAYYKEPVIFTDREFELLTHVHAQLNNDAIALKMGITTETVRTSRKKIIEKYSESLDLPIGVRTNINVIAYKLLNKNEPGE